VWLFAFCAAALAAFALEATVFNFPSYLRYFAGAATAVVEPSETEPGIIKTTDGTRAEIIENGIRFSGLDRNVTSIYARLDFDGVKVETMDVFIQWTDDGSSYRYKKTHYKYLPHENYAPLQSCGKVSDILLTFNNDAGEVNINIEELVINKPIPFYFSGLRLSVISFLLFALFSLVNKSLRAKAAYYLFEYGFDHRNKKQNVVYACTVTLLILFSWVCVYASYNGDILNSMPLHQYDIFLVDALMSGRTWLEYGNPEILLNAERPYDYVWRRSNGYNKDIPVDFAWYEGKYYCYFGVVPAVLVYLPYKAITGNYLPNSAATFLFGAISVILLALMWRYFVKKYMPDTKYALYLLSFLTLFFGIGISMILRFPSHYAMVQGAGFMFAAAGILLLLKSTDNEKVNCLGLFFACLCLALVFGCRPSIGPASLLIPAVLWRRRSWKLLLIVMIPYVLVAIPLCWYNYVRFDSIFDFGLKYTMNANNIIENYQQNIFGKIIRVFTISANLLFQPHLYSIEFPFVKPQPWVVHRVTHGVVWANVGINAMINYPVVFCLSYFFINIFKKDKPKPFYGMSASLIVAAVVICMISSVATTVRYTFDFAAFIVFPSLFCAYYWCRRNAPSFAKDRLMIAYALIAATVFTGLFMFVNGEGGYDQTLYRYLEYSLGIFRTV
jgi:hypothetical protein